MSDKKFSSHYQADIIFDGSDGEMKDRQVYGSNFLEFIEKIEEIEKQQGKIEIWSALYIYGKEVSQIKLKVIETLNIRRKLND